MQIWIIAQRQNQTYGHGDFGQSWKLPTIGPYDSGPFHPAFPDKESALAYIEELEVALWMEPVSVELKG